MPNMTKDVLDEILEVQGNKSSMMLKNLIDNGLSREDLRKALFDRSGMTRVDAKVYYDHYKPVRNELKKQIRFLSTIINNPAPDWMNGHRNGEYLAILEKLRTFRESYKKKFNERYPKESLPKGLTWKRAVGQDQVVPLYSIILPIVEKINNKLGIKKYKKVDIYDLISHLWNTTYKMFEDPLSGKEILKIYENNNKLVK